jgi:predicted alpha/beta-fold hydrolase
VAPPSSAWSTRLEDPDLGSIRLTGRLSEPDASTGLVVLVHGLGGSCESPYVVEAASHLHAQGLACLRLSLRGADRTGEDIYHAGLTADLKAALASPEVSCFGKIAILGFSLGGHVALRLALDGGHEPVGAVVAVCPPVDLAAAAVCIDGDTKWPYRRYLLRRLFEIYEEVSHRRSVDRPVDQVRRTRTFVEFDSRVIAPRFGFADAWDYYGKVSVGPDLAATRVPTLIVAAKQDPMVPAASLESVPTESGAALEVCWSDRGGHLAFPRNLDLGGGGDTGLYPQITAWLERSL